MSTLNFLNSEKIQVYPSAYRGQNLQGKLYNPESRLPSENNMSKISYNLTHERDGFVISANTTTKEIEFNLKGYYFKAKFDSTTGDGRYLWVGIKIISYGNVSDTSNTDYADYALGSLKTIEDTNTTTTTTNNQYLDDDNVFYGLCYKRSDSNVISPFDNTDNITAELCIYDFTNNEVVSKSLLRISSDYIEDESNDVPIKEQLTTAQISGIEQSETPSSAVSLMLKIKGNIVPTDVSNRKLGSDIANYSFSDAYIKNIHINGYRNYNINNNAGPNNDYGLNFTNGSNSSILNLNSGTSYIFSNLNPVTVNSTTPSLGSSTILFENLGVKNIFLEKSKITSTTSSSKNEIIFYPNKDNTTGAVYMWGDGVVEVNNIKDKGLTTDSTGTADTHKSVMRDANGNLQSVSLKVNSPTTSSSTSLEFIDTVSQNSFGQISASKKKITIDSGDNQGQLKINGTNYNVTTLQTTSSPTFSTVKLTSNYITNSSNKQITLPASAGTLGTINWDDTNKVLVIKTN